MNEPQAAVEPLSGRKPIRELEAERHHRHPSAAPPTRQRSSANLPLRQAELLQRRANHLGQGLVKRPHPLASRTGSRRHRAGPSLVLQIRINS
jgi:hypothetical protein